MFDDLRVFEDKEETDSCNCDSECDACTCESECDDCVEEECFGISFMKMKDNFYIYIVKDCGTV